MSATIANFKSLNTDVPAVPQNKKFQPATDADPNLNQKGQTVREQMMPKSKNSQCSNSTQERKKNKLPAIDDSWMSVDLPGTNLPERIVFVVDTAKEPDCTQFETRTGAKFSPLTMIKRVIEIFVNVKSGLQQRHEFALMTLEQESVSWVCDYTNDRKSFLSYLRSIEEDPLDDNQSLYDLGPCFEKIFKNTDLRCNNEAPTEVTRVILIYARSHSIPHLDAGKARFDVLSKSSHFFVDSLYVHEPLGDANECQEVFAKLGALDTKQTSFILEAGRNPATLHNNMAKLIAHPLQRARQDNAPYSVFSTSANSQEVQTNA